MYFEIDLSTVPPAVTLREAGDFRGFKVVAAPVEHAYVDVETITRLAGEQASDPEWRKGLEQMLAYARDHDWVREDGAVRAHVETGA